MSWVVPDCIIHVLIPNVTTSANWEKLCVSIKFSLLVVPRSAAAKTEKCYFWTGSSHGVHGWSQKCSCHLVLELHSCVCFVWTPMPVSHSLSIAQVDLHTVLRSQGPCEICCKLAYLLAFPNHCWMLGQLSVPLSGQLCDQSPVQELSGSLWGNWGFGWE